MQENSYSTDTFTHSAFYDFSVSFHNSSLNLALHSEINDSKVYFYNSLLCDSVLPESIKEEFKNVQTLFEYLRENGNFEVNPLKGVITLLKKNFQSKDIKLRKL